MKLTHQEEVHSPKVKVAMRYQPAEVRNHFRPLLSTFLETELPRLSQKGTPTYSPDNPKRNQEYFSPFRKREPKKIIENRLNNTDNGENQEKNMSLESIVKTQPSSKSPKRPQRSEKKTLCVPILKYPVYLPNKQSHDKLSKEKQAANKQQRIKQILRKIHMSSFTEQAAEEAAQKQPSTTLQIKRIMTEAQDIPAPQIKMGRGRSFQIKETLKNAHFRSEKRSPPRQRAAQDKKTMPKLLKVANPWDIGPWNGELSRVESRLCS